MTDKTPSTRDQFYADLFTTALEGGINYWAWVETYRWDTPDYTAEVRPFDSVDPEGVTLTIDRSTIMRGWNHLLTLPDHWMAKEARRHQSKLDEIDFDPEWADVVVQLGLFGEVVYG